MRSDIFTSPKDGSEFANFIKKLSNATFENFEQVPLNRTFGIAGSDYLDLLWNLSIAFHPEINSGTVHKLSWQDTITELGICYAINSRVAIYNSYRWAPVYRKRLFQFIDFSSFVHRNPFGSYWKRNRWDYVQSNATATVHPLDGEIYAQILNLSSAYEVYFHGSFEVPDIARQRYSFAAADYTTVDLLALETITSDNAKE